MGWKLGAGVVAVCMVLMPAVPAFAQGASPVAVDAVRQEALSQTVPVLGRLVAAQRGVVAALTRGPVLELHVAVGDRVAEGDVLVTQATDRLERSRDAAKESVDAAIAAVATAQSQLDLAGQELARLEKLRGSAAYSGANRDDKAFEVAVRKAQVNEVRARVAQARAVLAEAQLEIDLGVIRAPFNGVVVARHTVRGAYLTIGDPTVTLINDEKLEVEADVPAQRLTGLEPGRAVSLHLDGKDSHTAVVRAVVPEENALTRTRVVRFIPDFIDPKGVLPAAGQTVTVDLPVGDVRDIVSVHKDAILPKGDQNIVYIVQEDGTVAVRPVQLGEAVATRFIVLGGLIPGDLVVILGNERLRPGQAVTWPGKPEAVPDSNTTDGDATGEAAPSKTAG